MTAPTLSDRRAHLRRLLEASDAALAERQELARAVWHAETAADAARLCAALTLAIDRELAAERALPGGAGDQASPPTPVTAYVCPVCGGPRLRPGPCPDCGRPDDAPAPDRHRGCVPPSIVREAAPAAPPTRVTACEGVPVEPGRVSSWGPNGPPPRPPAAPAAPAPTPAEDLAGLFVDPAAVKAAYCADRLAAAKPNKPASVTPVLVEGSPYVCVGYGDAIEGRGEARLVPIMRREGWAAADLGDVSPLPHPLESPATSYRGRLVTVEGEEWVMLGSAEERRVCWSGAAPWAPAPPRPAKKDRKPRGAARKPAAAPAREEQRQEAAAPPAADPAQTPPQEEPAPPPPPAPQPSGGLLFADVIRTPTAAGEGA